ncbi:MAG: prepilin-type N-terminal cleavage/methylation domain-containing protein [Phycisphaerales bacterium]|nr:MAG: prepilin-type N-terminal cleavage/methylation domain-containing protein [Phycisphaerales bacterium]
MARNAGRLSLIADRPSCSALTASAFSSPRPVARGRRAFSLIELLVVVSVTALLVSILLPSLRRAREQARATVCASNIRQLVVANAAYASEHKGRYCPGGAEMKTGNLHRWHGTRSDRDEPFDPRHGPLVPYLGAGEGIRACPSFRDFVRDGDAAFEKGNGGYGYNQAYIGRIVRKHSNGSFEVVTDCYGVLSERIRQPGQTVMFTDAAFAGTAAGVIEYSFAEPRFHPEWIQFEARADPSIHFRHDKAANVAWCDGHVGREIRTFTWRSAVCAGDPDRENIGWFGQADDNGYFDLQ